MNDQGAQGDRFDVDEDISGGGKGRAATFGVASLVLVLLTLVVGALLVNWLAGRLSEAEARSVKLQEALDTDRIAHLQIPVAVGGRILLILTHEVGCR